MSDQYDDYIDDPYYGPYSDDDYCDHEDYDIDILEGRAHCYRCGQWWYLTGDELDKHLRLQSEYDAAMYREFRRENTWWKRVIRWLAFKFRNRAEVSIYDEVPF